MRAYKDLRMISELYCSSNSDLARNNYQKCAELVISEARENEKSGLESFWEKAKAGEGLTVSKWDRRQR